MSLMNEKEMPAQVLPTKTWGVLTDDARDAVERVMEEYNVDFGSENELSERFNDPDRFSNFVGDIVHATTEPFIAELNDAAEWARNARDFRERQAEHLKAKREEAEAALANERARIVAAIRAEAVRDYWPDKLSLLRTIADQIERGEIGGAS